MYANEFKTEEKQKLTGCKESQFFFRKEKLIARKLSIQSWNLYQVMGLDVLSRDLCCESPDNMPQ